MKRIVLPAMLAVLTWQPTIAAETPPPPGQPRDFTLQIAKILFGITPFGFTHDGRIFLRLRLQVLEFLLLREEFTLTRRKLFLQSIHRGLRLRCSLD